MNTKFTLLAIACLTLLAGHLSADDPPPMLDRASITVGGFFSEIGTEVRLDGTAGQDGSEVDFEGELGLADSRTLSRVGGTFLFGQRHEVGLSWYRLTRRGSHVTEQDISFGDVVFPAGTDVTAFSTTTTYDLTYTYWALLRERQALGVSGGLVLSTFEAGISSQAVTALSEKARLNAPVPLIGGEYRFAPHERVRVRLPVKFIFVSDIDGISGNVLDATPAVEVRLYRGLELGAAYDILRYRVEVDRDAFHGDLHYYTRGLQLYALYRF